MQILKQALCIYGAELTAGYCSILYALVCCGSAYALVCVSTKAYFVDQVYVFVYIFIGFSNGMSSR